MKKLLAVLLGGSFLIALWLLSGEPLPSYADDYMCHPLNSIGGQAKTVSNPATGNRYALNGRGCANIRSADIKYFQSQGFVDYSTAGPSGGPVTRVPYIDVRQYGAQCDGITDDYAALQAAFTAGAGNLIVLPSGTCNFSQTLTLVGTGTSLRGAGKSASILNPTFLTGDELFVGDNGPRPGTYEYHLSDFTIFPLSIIRTSGYTIHVKNAHQVFIDNVESDNDILNANAGNPNHLLPVGHYAGIWTDNAGSTHVDHSEFWAQNDVWTLNNTVDSTIHSTNLRFGTIGLHFTGGVDGFSCTQSNIESNGHNLLVDNTIAATDTNHAATFGNACYFDTATNGDNVVINTNLGGLNLFQFSGLTIETQNGNAVHIISAPNTSWFEFDNVGFGSTSLPTVNGSGIKQDDCSTKISITGGSVVWFNNGYGINQNCTYDSTQTNPIYVASDTLFAQNASGSTSYPLITTLGSGGKVGGTVVAQSMALNGADVLNAFQVQTDVDQRFRLTSLVSAVAVESVNSSANTYVPMFLGGKPTNIHNDGVIVMQITSATATLVSGSVLRLGGTSSGTVTVQVQPGAGTYNYNLPTSAGSAGNVLLSQGGGTTAMNWSTGLTVDSAGSVTAPAYRSNGAHPTITGTCAAPTAVTGGNTVGTFTTSTGCAGQSVILAFVDAAPTGWACQTTNRTLSTRTMAQTADSTTTATVSGTTSNGDVIQFSCLGY